MPCDGHGTTSTDDSNLKHVYFFVEQATSGRNDQSSAASESNTSTQTRSRTPSPGSKGATSDSTTASTSTSEMNPLAEAFTPSPKKCDAPPKPGSTTIYEVRQTEGKGLGLFATSFIKRGTLIFTEEPLLTITKNALQQAWSPYCRLSAAETRIYDSLSSFHPLNVNLEQAARLYLIDHNNDTLTKQEIDGLVATQVRVMSIFAVNNYQFGSSGLAIYATASRLNHSCVPNVHHSYNPTLKKLTIHAVRDIHENEELLTTYLGGEAVYQSRVERNEKLRTGYGFECACPACSDNTGMSDGRRELMAGMTWGLNQFNDGNIIPNPFVPAHPIPALKQAEDLVSVMLAEGIVTVELTKAYRTASSQALKLRDFDRALEYAWNEAEVERNCLGNTLNDLRKIGIAASCWIEEILDVMRAEKGEDVVREYRSAARSQKKWMRKREKRVEEVKAKARELGGVLEGSEDMVNWQ